MRTGFYQFAVVCLFASASCRGQIVNYINNGSFEEVLTSTSTPLFYSARFWGGIDSSTYYGVTLSRTMSPVQVPLSSYTYQWPKHGNNYLGSTFFSAYQSSNRGYPRNRLKKKLQAGKAYCFSAYVNLSNSSVNAIAEIGAYFGDGTIDTISLCDKPITYLFPQVQNPANNIIADTLNWVLLQGQFVATGTEKYALIGNFSTNANTNTIIANPTHSPAVFADYLIDNVSLIESDLSAYAGRDTIIFSGDSLFLGRTPDVGIDEACIWYKLPGPQAIDTVAGFWIKPVENATYAVKQEICGLVKWDTVNIYMDALNIDELKRGDRLQIMTFPSPASGHLFIRTNSSGEQLDITISDMSGRTLGRQQVNCMGQTCEIFFQLVQGVYLIRICNSTGACATKKLLVSG